MEYASYEICLAILVTLVVLLFAAKGSVFCLVALILLVAYLFCFRRQGLVLLGVTYFLFIVVAHLVNIFSYL